MNKRFFVGLLTLFLFIQSSLCGFVTVHAVEAGNAQNDTSVAEEYITAEGLKYVTNSRKIVITGYAGVHEDVVIPSTINNLPVVAISEGAFEDNLTIRSLKIEPGLRSIDDFAFSGCNNLENVILSESVISIAGRAFDGTPFLENQTDEFVIFNGILYRYNGNSDSVTIPSGIHTIGDYSFSFSETLKEVIISEGVETIGQGAFDLCYNLINVYIPDSVKTIKSSAFYACSGLETITIPKGVCKIYSQVFGWCHKLKSILVAEDNQHYASKDGILYNKDFSVLVKYPNNKKETYFDMPNSVVELGFEAFYGCTYLESINLSNKLRLIGSSAFSECSSLKEIELPDSVQIIREHVFDYCTSLGKVVIPSTVYAIGEDIFYGCNDVKVYGTPNTYAEVYAMAYQKEFNDKVASYGSYAGFEYGSNTVSIITKFNGTNNHVEIPSNISGTPVLAIGDAFTLCRDITTVTMPESIKYIGDYAFMICSSLNNVVIPQNVESIGSAAFEMCKSLTEISIPDTVKYIGDYAFMVCESLKNIELPKNITTISEGMFWKCSNLEQIIIPQNVTKIEERAFETCTKLTSVYVPETVTSIAEDAFDECYLLTIIAPKNSYAISYAKDKDIPYIEIEYHGDGEGFEGNIPSDVVDNSKDNNTNLPIVTDKLSAIFDINSLIEIQYRHGNKEIKFSYNVVEKDDYSGNLSDIVNNSISNGGKIVDLNLVDSEGKKIEFSTAENGGYVTITIPYDKPVSANKVTVYYISPDGKKIDMNRVYSPSKKTISFSTTHFSLFSIETDAEGDVVFTEFDGEKVTITSTFENVVDKTLIYASYKGDFLLNVKFIPISVVPGEKSYTIDNFIPGNFDKIKAMLWQDMDCCKPICNSIEFLNK